VVGYNPLPDAQTFALTTPDGVRISADGKVSLLRVEYRPWDRHCDISHVLKTGQEGPHIANRSPYQDLPSRRA